ncbi:nuclease [Idiomarina sp. MD25a]|uniref:ExeM/NucH family extracellular endonuclease n=1 Tax=Idiomarina sp. MD25a TaxID=1889913 RepID=UPI0008F8910C|nr:ExeM/NucH family extracellular endonuclease [Idiomarina sp. MD25a]OIN01929.1 nuclease [Idiomarina sp. MD25a]
MKKLLIATALLLSTGTAFAQQCGEEQASITPISVIQGHAWQSPLLDQEVTTAGTVTANWTADNELAGFFLQSNEPDDDPLSSEGIFVSVANEQTFTEGDLVVVTGRVAEVNEQTRLVDVSAMQSCPQARPMPAPVTVRLPFKSNEQREQYENMRVTLVASDGHDLTISGHYQLPRHGYFDVSSGRLFTPSQIVEPGKSAREQMQRNQLNRVQVDDNSDIEPSTLPFSALTSKAQNSVRSGTTLEPIVGILTEFRGRARIQPTEAIVAKHIDEPESPNEKGDHLRISSFNVLNLFNGNGEQNGFPTERGAQSFDAYQRQQTKILSALVEIDADVFGLMEVENDGYGPDSAIVQLVNELNSEQSSHYVIAEPRAQRLGDDQIAVGLIYNRNRVKPLGHAHTLTEGPFRSGSRPPLAQVFEDKQTSKQFTVVVNHFKSKGGCPEQGANANQRDGQYCWNQQRVDSAKALTEWIAQNDFPAPVLLGDFNAYFKEDPIRYIESQGFTNVSEAEDYSYVFDSQAGALDHVFVDKTLAESITNVQHIHYNSDEPTVFSYEDTEYFEPGPYRSSDHDPVIIDVEF